jgi:hypothetical protein
MPYICLIRNDIPQGILQILDLQPNESQRNLIYDPRGQTKYVRRVQNELAVTSGVGPIYMANATKGLAAYLIDTIENAAGGIALTAAFANTIAAALIARLDAYQPMDLASVNAVIQATVAASGIGIGASTATLNGVLKVLAGAEYLIPAGATLRGAAGVFVVTAAGIFTTGEYLPTFESGYLNISLAEGHLEGFSAATFEYNGVVGRAVVVLNDNGTVKVPVI